MGGTGAPQSCPETIRSLARTMPTSADVYSFGLLVAFMSLDGVGSAETGPGTWRDLDRLKFSDLLGEKLGSKIASPRLETGEVPADVDLYIALVRGMLKSDPTQRISSLSGIRKRVFGLQVPPSTWYQLAADVYSRGSVREAEERRSVSGTTFKQQLSILAGKTTL